MITYKGNFSENFLKVSNEEYEKLRKSGGNFFYGYFLTMGGTPMPEDVFNGAVSLWMMDVFGPNAIDIILRKLDQNHNFSQTTIVKTKNN